MLLPPGCHSKRGAWTQNSTGGGQPSGFDVATASVLPETPPATAQLEDNAHGSRWKMQQNVSTFQGHEGNPQDMQDLGISFDDSLAEGDELSEDDIRQLGLFGTHHGDEGAALSSLEIKIPNL
ncbi:uncharacterized protein LOC119407201 [Rhipicephalus sanguineus]|uniref:uncharacterized protein LOC119407201 n=1 Tax=Rhipicephalus sanguineus TaxID=34632 RepID=UPI00189636E7|nr:uncharacterized protein LOC119407201 [Rhipicephalus sanguineus]